MNAKNGLRCGDILALVHHCLERAIPLSEEHSASYSRCGFPDETTRAGFCDYVRTLAAVHRAHIIAENEVLFPRFRALLPDAPFDDLIAQHARMAAVLGRVWERVEGAYWESAPERTLAGLNRTLGELRTLWTPHRRIEEAHLSPAALSARLDPEEDQSLAARLAELSLDYAGPDYLVMPFALYNLARSDRRLISEAMAPLVIHRLIPGAWRDKWRPMSPFLLL